MAWTLSLWLFLPAQVFLISHMRRNILGLLLNFLISAVVSDFLPSYYASTLFPTVSAQPRAVKRQRLMTSPQSRSAGLIANPQSQVVLQSPQAQQQIAANKLTSAANSLLQLQQQQQLILANATPVVNLCNSIQSQNFLNNNNTNGFKLCSVDNTENCSQQASAGGPFKVYSELKTSHTLVPGFCISIKHISPQMWTSNEHFSCLWHFHSHPKLSPFVLPSRPHHLQQATPTF